MSATTGIWSRCKWRTPNCSRIVINCPQPKSIWLWRICGAQTSWRCTLVRWHTYRPDPQGHTDHNLFAWTCAHMVWMQRWDQEQAWQRVHSPSETLIVKSQYVLCLCLSQIEHSWCGRALDHRFYCFNQVTNLEFFIFCFPIKLLSLNCSQLEGVKNMYLKIFDW